MMWWPWAFGGAGWWGWLMMIPMALFWGLIIFVIVWLVQRTVSPGHATTSAESALELLKKRYARGEISKEEYERMRRDLE